MRAMAGLYEPALATVNRRVASVLRCGGAPALSSAWSAPACAVGSTRGRPACAVPDDPRAPESGHTGSLGSESPDYLSRLAPLPAKEVAYRRVKSIRMF